MKKTLKAEGREDLLSTEVVGLSDWMHESTLFNIITNITFFKSYTTTKIFGIWKKNVRYRNFIKIRQKLVRDSFISKPTFAENLMEVNRCLFDLGQNKTIFSKISDNKAWDMKTEFNYEQDQTRKIANTQYENIIANKMTVIVRKVQNEIYEKCNLKDVDDQDEMKFGQQVKQKPMNLKRREEEEKVYLLQIGNRDRERLPNFIKLIDYVMIETLVSISHNSMTILL
jgi:dynein heavy chain